MKMQWRLVQGAHTHAHIQTQPHAHSFTPSYVFLQIIAKISLLIIYIYIYNPIFTYEVIKEREFLGAVTNYTFTL